MKYTLHQRSTSYRYYTICHKLFIYRRNYLLYIYINLLRVRWLKVSLEKLIFLCKQVVFHLASSIIYFYLVSNCMPSSRESLKTPNCRYLNYLTDFDDLGREYL